jgi:predicted transcriptional regulator
MDLHQLRYFLTVARTGSFVRAAEEENVAQPSLSQQIKKLETALAGLSQNQAHFLNQMAVNIGSNAVS